VDFSDTLNSTVLPADFSIGNRASNAAGAVGGGGQVVMASRTLASLNN
jgi:hypothetical protein